MTGSSATNQTCLPASEASASSRRFSFRLSPGLGDEVLQMRFKLSEAVTYSANVSDYRWERLERLTASGDKERTLLLDGAFRFTFDRELTGFSLTASGMWRPLSKKVGVKKRELRKAGLLFLDFDRLPSRCRDWDSLEEELRLKFGTRAVVTRTMSGKVKVMFAVRHDSARCRESWVAKRAVVALLADPTLYHTNEGFEDGKLSIDFSWSGLNLCGLATWMVEQYERERATLQIVGSVEELARSADHLLPAGWMTFAEEEAVKTAAPAPDEDPDLGAPVKAKKSKKRGLTRVRGRLPAAVTALIRNAQEERVVRILLGGGGLGRDGAIVPLKALAEEARASVNMVARFVERLVEAGQLELVSDYKAHRQARRYVARGALLAAWEGVAKQRWKAKPLPEPEVFFVADGNWNERLFELTNYFKTAADYLAYVARVPHLASKPGRWEKAVATWARHARRNGLKES